MRFDNHFAEGQANTYLSNILGLEVDDLVSIKDAFAKFFVDARSLEKERPK